MSWMSPVCWWNESVLSRPCSSSSVVPRVTMETVSAEVPLSVREAFEESATVCVCCVSCLVPGNGLAHCFSLSLPLSSFLSLPLFIFLYLLLSGCICLHDKHLCCQSTITMPSKLETFVKNEEFSRVITTVLECVSSFAHMTNIYVTKTQSLVPHKCYKTVKN